MLLKGDGAATLVVGLGVSNLDVAIVVLENWPLVLTMCMNMCMDMCRHVYGHVYRHVYRCIDMCIDMCIDV